MDKLPTDIDKEATDGLSTDEMASLLIAYAQENAMLEEEIERLRRNVAGLTRSASARLQYIRNVRGAEAAVRRFCADPAIAPYVPDLETVIASIFGEPAQYGGETDD